MRFLVRRVGTGLFQLAAISLLIFLLFRLLPGDLFSAELADPRMSRETIEAWRAARGLDQSWARRYLSWMASCARGDFGTSIAYGVPVRALIAPRLRQTSLVAVPALALAWLLGLPAALLAARFRMPGGFEPGAAAAAMAPDVITVSLLLWLAVAAGVSITGAWLPIAGLVVALSPVVFLHASGALRDARDLEFVRIAESRGIGGTRLLLKFVLAAAANPLISLAGISVAATLSSSFVVESLTGWPGLGPLFLEAVQARDYPIVETILILLASTLILSNIAADLVLYRLDPRIRLPEPGRR